MRAKTPAGITFDVPHEVLLEQFKNANEGWLDLASRLERGDQLSAFERETIAIGLRLYVESRKPPARPRGNKPKFDAGEAALRYGYMRRNGDKHADAIGKLADRFNVSEVAVSNAIRPMRATALYIASIGAHRPKDD